MARLLPALYVILLPLLTGCQDLAHTVSWETRPFVRVPGTLPNGYDDHGADTTVRANGWNFKHIVACSPKRGPEAHWWMVWPDDHKKLKLGNASWVKMLFTGTAIRDSAWKRLGSFTPEIADATFAAFGAYPQMVQPDLIFKREAVQEEAAEKAKEYAAITQRALAEPKPQHLELGALPLAGWAKGPSDDPPYDPLWNQRDAYSQMDTAKREVRRLTGSAGGGIRIGILDVGYNHRHLLVPKNTLDSHGQPGGDRKGERIGDAINALACAEGNCPIGTPGETNGSHGMKAMSILAGGAYTLVDPQAGTRSRKVIPAKLEKEGIELGGAPDAVIVPARVAPWIFSHSTANLAYAIDYASRVQKCDVISMSHGGTPSAMWIDAVNAAYDRGTATFAASGDYYNLACFHLGIIAPSATVYPAACRRVQSVAGLSANGTPYGMADSRHYPLYYLAPWHWFPLRGSFGADGAHRDWLHTSSASMNARTDKAQREHGGLLRAQPISTWSPNVASAQPPDKDHGFDVLNLNWDGTSAATPQAAAAAALWLARHRNEIEDEGLWQDWRKAEAVYVAMIKSAGGRMPGQKATPLQERDPDAYCGAGSLKAADMLKVSFDDARHTNVPEKLTFPSKQSGISRDFYDGQRSGAAILGLVPTDFPPYRQRADAIIDATHVMTDVRQRQPALTVIYFNQRLGQQWNNGLIPRRDPKLDAKEQANDAAHPGTDITLGHQKDRLQSRKGWLSRLFSPDAPELWSDAEAKATRAMPHKS